MLLYITRTRKAVLEMIETETIQQLSDGINQIFGAAQTKNMTMAKVGVLKSHIKGDLETTQIAWNALPREKATWKSLTAVVMYRVNAFRSARQAPLLSVIPGQNCTELVLVDEPAATIADLWAITPMSLRAGTPTIKNSRRL